MAKRKGKRPRPRHSDRIATKVYIKRTPKGAVPKRAVCIITGKECFETESACWRRISSLNLMGTCAPYRCFDCMKVHMTSSEVTVGRRMRERERGF